MRTLGFLFCFVLLTWAGFGDETPAAPPAPPAPPESGQSTWLGTNLSTVAPWGSGTCFTIAPDGTVTFDPRLLNLLSGAKSIRFVDWSLINVGSTESAWTNRSTLDTARIDPRTSKDLRVPLEVQVALCNTLKCGGWFCVPHLASDEYARKMAELITAKLDPSLQAAIEFSNECWNGVYMQAQWCREQGIAKYPNSRPLEAQTWFYVDRALQVFRIFGPRFKRVLCFQFTAPGSMVTGLAHAKDTAGWELNSLVDAVAVAPYFGAAIAKDPSIATMSPKQVLDAITRIEGPRIKAGLAKDVEILKPYALPLWAYECGQHLVNRQATEDVQKLLAAVNNDARMEAIYRAYFQMWLDVVGPTLVHHYSLACKPSQYGYWGMLDNLDQTDSPKLRAFREALNKGK